MMLIFRLQFELNAYEIVQMVDHKTYFVSIVGLSNIAVVVDFGLIPHLSCLSIDVHSVQGECWP